MVCVCAYIIWRNTTLVHLNHGHFIKYILFISYNTFCTIWSNVLNKDKMHNSSKIDFSFLVCILETKSVVYTSVKVSLVIWAFCHILSVQLNRDSPTLRDRGGVGLPKVGSIYVFNLICTSI